MVLLLAILTIAAAVTTLGPSAVVLVLGALRIYRGDRGSRTGCVREELGSRVWSKRMHDGVDNHGHTHLRELMGHILEDSDVALALELLPMAGSEDDFAVIEAALLSSGFPGREWRVIATHALKHIRDARASVPSDNLSEKMLVFLLEAALSYSGRLPRDVEFELVDIVLGWIKLQRRGLEHYAAILDALVEISALSPSCGKENPTFRYGKHK